MNENNTPSDQYDVTSPFLGRIEQTGDNTFEAPKTIVKSVTAARSMYSTLRTNHLRRVMVMREIEGLLQGNPPYDPQALKSAGLDYVANFNDMSARAVYERAALAYWNLLNNSEYIARFVIRGEDPALVKYSQVLAEHWDFVVRNRWPSFLTNVASLTSQLVKFGVSPALFPDERDPRWRVVELNKFLIPDQTQSDLEMLTTVFVETEFTLQELWGIYDEFKGKEDKEKSGTGGTKDHPWNLDQIGQLLVFFTAVSSTNDRDGYADIYELQKRRNDGDLALDPTYNQCVRVVSLLQKEYNGKISHYMFHRYAEGTQGATIPEEFVFFQQDQYKNMQEALVIFTMNPGEYTIHANKGLGHKIYSLAQAKIQLDCTVVDMAKWSSTPILKSSSLNSKDVEQIKFYPGVPTNIGTAEFVQNQLGDNLEGVIAASQYLQNLINFNITYSGSDPGTPDPDTGSISPTQTRLLAFREFSVLKNNIMHFYAVFDKLIQNMVIKMLHSREGYPAHDLAKEWKERCMADGVPPEVFEMQGVKLGDMPKHLEAYATRAAGAGSQVAHLIGLQELQQIAGSFTAREEAVYKEQYISATVGPEFVKAYLDKTSEADENVGGSSLAAVENAIMQAGNAPVFSRENDQRAHMVTHLALSMDVARQLQAQEMDPIAADDIFNQVIPHMEMHLQALEQNPFAKEFVQQVKPGFIEIQKIAILNRKNALEMLKSQAKKQQELATKEQETMSDEQRKDMIAERDANRQDFKLQKSIEHQEKAGETKAKALNEKTAADIRNKTIKTFAEISNDKIKTAADKAKKIRGDTISPNDFENPSNSK